MGTEVAAASNPNFQGQHSSERDASASGALDLELASTPSRSVISPDSYIGQFAEFIGRVTENFVGNHCALFACAAMVGVGLAEGSVKGQFRNSPTTDAMLLNNAQQGIFATNTGFIKVTPQGSSSSWFASFTAISPNQIVFAGHTHNAINWSSDEVKIGLGNFLTTPESSLTSLSASNTAVHPQYQGGFIGPDIAKATVSIPNSNVQTLTIASAMPSTGTTIMFGGYGRPGSSDIGGLLEFDGNKRAGSAAISGVNPINVPSELYKSARLNPVLLPILPDNLAASSGTSGGTGLVRNQLTYELEYFGPVAGSTVGFGGGFGSDQLTSFTFAGHPDVRTWVAAPVSEPVTILSVSALALAVFKWRRRNRTDNTTPSS